MDMTEHDQMEQALLRDHDLAAAAWLIQQGRELEFTVGEQTCFLSRYATSRRFSLWVEEKEQAFDSPEELLDHAAIGGVPLSQAWTQAVIQTLF